MFNISDKVIGFQYMCGVINKEISPRLFESIIKQYIATNHLESNLKKVYLSNSKEDNNPNVFGVYNQQEKSLYIPLPKLLDLIYKKHSDKNIETVYFIAICTLYHELVHAKQDNDKSMSSQVKTVLNVSQNIKKLTDNYELYHDLFPFEAQANFEGIAETLKFNHKYYINNYVSSRLLAVIGLKEYKLMNGKLLSPASILFTKSGLPNIYNELEKIDLSIYERISLGMNLPLSVYDDLNQIINGEKKVGNVKEYIKSL